MQRWWGESREGGERSAGPGGRGGPGRRGGSGGHGGRWAGMGGGGLGVPGAVAKGEGWRGAASPERRRGFGAPGIRSGAGARARRASGTPGRRLPRVDSGVGVWARGRSARSGRLGRLGSRSGAGGWAQGIGGGLAVGPGGHPGRQPVVAPWAPRTARRRRALWGTGIPDGAQRFGRPGTWNVARAANFRRRAALLPRRWKLTASAAAIFHGRLCKRGAMDLYRAGRGKRPERRLARATTSVVCRGGGAVRRGRCALTRCCGGATGGARAAGGAGAGTRGDARGRAGTCRRVGV